MADAIEEKGVSAAWISRELGISRQAVSKWINGKSMPGVDVLISLASTLGQDDLYFLRADISAGEQQLLAAIRGRPSLRLLVYKLLQWEERELRVFISKLK